LLNAVVGWGRPVYTGEENAPLLNKINTASATPVKATSADAAKKSVNKSQNIKKTSNGSKGSAVK
jgi:hypothetical protein